jgi:hypothetical protein
MLHVLRRIHRDHATAVFELRKTRVALGQLLDAYPLARCDHRRVRQRDAAMPRIGAEDLRQLRDCVNVVVFRDRPEARPTPRLRTPRNRLFLTQLREDRVRLRHILEGFGVRQRNSVFLIDCHDRLGFRCGG